jgi:hypothetical protein
MVTIPSDKGNKKEFTKLEVLSAGNCIHQQLWSMRTGNKGQWEKTGKLRRQSRKWCSKEERMEDEGELKVKESEQKGRRGQRRRRKGKRARQ